MCTRRLRRWTRPRAAAPSRSWSRSMRPQNSSLRATTSSAAADGVGARIAAAKDLDDVADRRAVERCDDADFPGEHRQRTLPARIEQAIFLEPLLQLIEGQLERAETLRLEMLADELVLALRFVHRDAPARHDVQAIGRLELQVAQCGPENHAANLRRRILQREIQMPGVPEPAVGELALDPHLEELRFEQIANTHGELRDRQDTASGDRRRKAGLIRRTQRVRPTCVERVLWDRLLRLFV